MTEVTFLLIFSSALLLCIIKNISIIYSLTFGFFLFFTYGLINKFSLKNMISFSLSGIKTVKNILLTFILIGMITAIWRVCGTIPFLVYYSTKLCTPTFMILITFILCCIISTLTGTSFGTAATVGVVCMTISNSMGISEVLIGGAILSGCYFGDRCSPMSTSALLISELTQTSIFKNIIIMIRTSFIPLVLSCIFYLTIGLLLNNETSVSNNIVNIFSNNFSLHILVVIPAVLIIVLSLFRINVKTTMSISIICGVIIALFIQNISPNELLKIILLGYHPQNSELNIILGGGGLISMINVFIIICLSSCYSGIFNGTGFLNNIKIHIKSISKKISPFGGILITTIITAFIACNQTLTIMLTHNLCEDIEKDKTLFASHLENTAVVIPPLIPWSIACAMPLAIISAPTLSIISACYLYLLPVWNYITTIYSQRRFQTN